MILYSIQTNFHKHIPVPSQLSFQNGGFPSTQWAGLISRMLELLDEEEESSLCLALRQSEMDFQPLNHLKNHLQP